MINIEENLLSVREALDNSYQVFGLEKTASAKVIAVSKRQNIEAITELLQAGQNVFGENRVQEAAEKWKDLRKTWPNIELHLIGPLQTNKVPDAVALFDMIQTVDRPKLAEALVKEMKKIGKKVPCLIQINTGEELQKSGIAPQEADEFITWCIDDIGLPVKGLMCIPPADELAAPHFALLSKIAKRHDLPELSMGMSSDYTVAAAMGATFVRVGTAIFGPRQHVEENNNKVAG